jgi:hypothetical protein
LSCGKKLDPRASNGVSDESDPNCAVGDPWESNEALIPPDPPVGSDPPTALASPAVEKENERPSAWASLELAVAVVEVVPEPTWLVVAFAGCIAKDVCGLVKDWLA